MTPRPSSEHHESFEPRVLTALAMGASTPEEIAAGLTETPQRVRQVLEWAVGAEVVSRVDLPGGPTYTLTSKGREVLSPVSGLHDVVREAELPETLQTGTGTGTGTGTVSGVGRTSRAEVGPAVPRVQWRHVVYAVLYVVLGLGLLFLRPVVGVLALVAGLGLGAWSLRPLFAGGTTRGDGS